jgi:DNA-binding protein H-NS
MDEVTIAIYKDAQYAPPEVLEELNRVELPEEMKAQQRMVAEQRRQQDMKAIKEQEQQQREALKSMAEKDGSSNQEEQQNLATLNTQKRDRRKSKGIMPNDKGHKTNYRMITIIT